MSVPRSPSQKAPRTAKRSIWVYFVIKLIIPVAVLVLLWGAVVAAVLTGYPHGPHWHWLIHLRSGRHALAGAAVIGGSAIVVVLAAIAMMGRHVRRLGREIDGLAAAARQLAAQPLPQAGTDGPLAAQPLLSRPRSRVRQIAAVGDAIAAMHSSAVAAATAEAGLRHGFREILVSLGKRNQSLLHRQLRIIDQLERQASSPAELAQLFTLDHLTTRMRRHAESLTILSNAAPGRSWGGPVPVIDVARAAAAEVEDYTRVVVVCESDEAIAAPAVVDMIHLLAELIENATLFSPSSTRVEVRAERVANGFAIEVEDRGLGVPADQLRELNAQLASPPDFDQADADRLGLFVVGRLAAKHGVYVTLTPSPYRGVKAVVVLPEGVVIPAPEPEAAGKPVTALADGRLSGLNLRAPEVLSLAGTPVAGPAAGGGRLRGVAVQERTAGASDRVADELAAMTVRGLPKRVRPGSSQPQDEHAGGTDAVAPAVRQAPVDSPAPDAARSLAASLQSSWRRSRQADDRPDSGLTADGRLPARRDAQGPNSALDSED
jgi:signal transduction histidine kinase